MKVSGLRRRREDRVEVMGMRWGLRQKVVLIKPIKLMVGPCEQWHKTKAICFKIKHYSFCWRSSTMI